MIETTDYPKDEYNENNNIMDTSGIDDEEENAFETEQDFPKPFPTHSQLLTRLKHSKLKILLDLKCNYLLLGPGFQFITPLIFVILFIIIFFYYSSILTCPNAAWVLLIVKITSLLFLLNLIKVAFSNPGHIIRSPPDREMPLNYYRCEKCWISRTEAREHRIVHCDDCDVCVMDYDHHCVVLGNCVGKKNILNFNSMLCLFIVTIFVVYGGLFYAIYACGVKSIGHNVGIDSGKVLKGILKSSGGASGN